MDDVANNSTLFGVAIYQLDKRIFERGCGQTADTWPTLGDHCSDEWLKEVGRDEGEAFGEYLGEALCLVGR